MKHKIKFHHLIAVVTLGVLSTTSCNKDLETHNPLKDDPTVPAQISNVSVVNKDGGSVITYTVPNDPHLLYVKAVYTRTNGDVAESKASYYSNSVVAEGFADTLEHEVKLYSVNRSEITSAPVVVKIKPLEAAIWKVYRSINLINAFGGYNLNAVNPTKADIAILVTKKNVFNEYETDNNSSVYTNIDSITSKIRGLDTLDYRFGFVVRDHWGNKTDTLYKSIKPLFETQISPANFTKFSLPGDAPQVTNGAALEYAWDNKLGWPWVSFTEQAAGGPNPHIITFSMGVTAKISRIWIRPFPEGTRFYYLTTMKRFEIYGATNPNLNGALDASWTLLGSYNVVKPSGLAYGTDDAVDQATGAAGFNWDVDLSAPKVKYIRVRCLENFAGGTAQSINELKVYGDPH
ncbi:MAG: DUF4959 domain-containing protein [Ferruginibacter sp.]